MISVVLTLLTAGVLIYVIVVAVRVCTAWFARGEDGAKIRAAGFWVITGSIAASMLRQARDWARDGAAAIWKRTRAWWERDGGAAPAGEVAAAAAPPPAPRRTAAARPAPPGLDDLAAAAVPAEGIPVPPDWAAVCARITAFEPDNDEDLLDFMRSEAAALPALAEAWHGLADTQLHVIGIDPAAVAGTLELADVLGDCAHDVVLAMRKFLTVYAEVQAAIAGGLILPHKAREFLTGAGS